MPHIIILGTCDTKLQELLYLRSQILDNGGDDCKVTLIDAGRSPVQHDAITVTQDTLTSKYAPEQGSTDVGGLPRGEVISYMIASASKCVRDIYQKGLQDPSEQVHGIVSAGGTGNTSLASGVMRATMPIGLPKIIVSTNASTDVSPVVGEMDITMMPSIVDIAGSNQLLNRILSNAAGAIVGMSKAYERSQRGVQEDSAKRKKRIGLSMFGVTTPCVDMAREYLEKNYDCECFIFHQTGAGGKAMERLIAEGGLDAVCDITTTELCDHQCGGVMDSGPHRLEAALKAGIPYVISCGALDMCNFGPRSTVPEKYQNRNLFEHNPTVTLMRTNVEECTAIGQSIADKVRTHAKNSKNVSVVLPLGGVSIIAEPKGPFHDPEADGALFAALRDGLKGSSVAIHELQEPINERSSAEFMVKQLVEMMK